MTINLIYDNDTDNDKDISMAVAFGLQLSGQINLLAITDGVYHVSGDGAVAGASALCLSQMRDYYGLGSIPMGRNVTSQYTNSTWRSFVTTLNADYPNSYSGSGTNIPDAVTVLRAALNSAANNSVIVFTGAPQTNMANLLASGSNYGGDGLASGASLISAKAIQLVVMGGDYNGGSYNPEYNLASYPSGASAVSLGWPTPIYYLGATFGASILVGGLLGANRPPNDIVRYAMGGTAYAGYDAAALFYAVRGATYGGLNYFTVSSAGYNLINASTGGNTFTAGSPGPSGFSHYYLELGSATLAQLESAIDLLSCLPVQPSQPVPLFFAKINESSAPFVDSGSGAHGNGTIGQHGSPATTVGDHYLDFSAATASNFWEVEWTDKADLAFTAAQPFTMLCTGSRNAISNTYQCLFQHNRTGTATSPPHGYSLYSGVSGGAYSLKVGSTNFSASYLTVQGQTDLGTGSSYWSTYAEGQSGSGTTAADLAANLQFLRYCDATNSHGGGAGISTTTGNTAVDLNQQGLLTAGCDGIATGSFSTYLEGNLRIYNSVLTCGQVSQAHFEPIDAVVQTSGTTLKIVMPLYLRPSFTTDSTGWQVLAGGSPVAVSSASASGQTVTLSLGSTIHAGQTISVGYYNGATVDTGSKRLLNFGNFAASDLLTVGGVRRLGLLGGFAAQAGGL